ncbi:MAG TPA: UbiA family prenyltransferase, partial [Gammaproteobacteria bacterium]
MTASLKDYFELTKPKVVALIVFTAIVGMLLARPVLPTLQAFIFGSLGIWLAAASAAALNHLIDRSADAAMARTRNRPMPTGKLGVKPVLIFALTLAVLSILVLVVFVNVLTAVLTFASMIGYAVIYTLYLKRATPQNIVIGGAAGAMPPVLG